eukprot:7936345-Alexandrium_andersonii.AAC.1
MCIRDRLRTEAVVLAGEREATADHAGHLFLRQQAGAHGTRFSRRESAHGLVAKPDLPALVGGLL